MLFKRLFNRYPKQLTDLRIRTQPIESSTIGSVVLSKKESIDSIASRFYGPQNEGFFYKIGFRNADRLLAWDLNTTNINQLSIPSIEEYRL